MFSRLFLVLTILTAAISADAQARENGQITVFSAASLKSALDEIVALYRAQTGAAVTAAYAGSSALARQIQYGAPADVFISANSGWMDLLESEGLIRGDTRTDLLSNRLALISPATSSVTLRIAPGFDLAGALGADGRLAMALVDAVPAGIYGRVALQRLDVWDSVRTQVAQADSVSAALRLVAIGEAPLGIVYATDAMAEPQVKLVGLFPDDTHPAILYPIAFTTEADLPGSIEFLDFLFGPEASAIFLRYGFLSPPEAR